MLDGFETRRLARPAHDAAFPVDPAVAKQPGSGGADSSPPYPSRIRAETRGAPVGPRTGRGGRVPKVHSKAAIPASTILPHGGSDFRSSRISRPLGHMAATAHGRLAS
jgi:hypothetical protein